MGKDKMKTVFVVLAEGEIKGIYWEKSSATEVYEAFDNAHVEEHIIQDIEI